MLRIKLHNKSKLKEAPLGDIVDFSDYRQNSMVAKNSVAYGRNDAFKAEAKLLWRDTEHNWILITPYNIRKIEYEPENFLRELKDFIKSKNFPKNSKIIVVGSYPFADDFQTPAWTTAHDIIGHGILNFNLGSRLRSIFVLSTVPSVNGISLRNILLRIWGMLPENLRLSKDNPNDIVPDIIFGFFSKALNPEKVIKILEAYKTHHPVYDIQAIVTSFTDEIQKFIDSFIDDQPRILQIW